MPAEANASRNTLSSPVLASPPTTPSKLIKRNPQKALSPLPPRSPTSSRAQSLPNETPSPTKMSRHTSRSDEATSSTRATTVSSFVAPDWGCRVPFGLESRFVEDLDDPRDREANRANGTPNKLRRRQPSGGA